LREKGITAQAAFQTSGIYYGDDSLMSCKMLHATKGLKDVTRVAATVGLQLKAVLRKPGGPVTFLSRVFLDPWTAPDSFCDPLKAMAKIHTTVSRVVDIDYCGYQKAQAYLTTDGQTPLVSHWARSYLRNLGTSFGDPENHESDVPFWYRYHEYRAAPWPNSVVDSIGLVADLVGVSSGELLSHCALLDEYAGPVMGMPKLDVAPQAVKVNCTVDGEDFVTGDPDLSANSNIISGQNVRTKEHKQVSVQAVRDSPAANVIGRDCRRGGDAGETSAQIPNAFTGRGASTSRGRERSQGTFPTGGESSQQLRYPPAQHTQRSDGRALFPRSDGWTEQRRGRGQTRRGAVSRGHVRDGVGQGVGRGRDLRSEPCRFATPRCEGSPTVPGGHGGGVG